ncbi:MAG TPA: hypothetical protein ENK45_04080 [Aliiroseovarius sp.]|nr:hypothetical protein [Aliiroseovarius sp.]
MSGFCGADEAVETVPPLHSTIVAMVSLASGIAANHPAMGQCQLDRLRQAGVPEAQIATVIEIARHIRDEAAEKLDFAFDQAAGAGAGSSAADAVSEGEACGCTPAASGQSCC